MSATVVDPNFYYQPAMRPEMSGLPVQSSVSGHSHDVSSSQSVGETYQNPGQLNYREAFPKSPKSQHRQLSAVMRPIYDDRQQQQPAIKRSLSRKNVPTDQVISNPLAKKHYSRSVSSLDISIETEANTPKPTLLKDFSGSASSIDFSKSVGASVRMLVDQLRGKSVHNSTASLSSLQHSDGSNGSGTGSGILCAPKSKTSKSMKDKPKRGSLRSRPSFFRKMRGNSFENESSHGSLPSNGSQAELESMQNGEMDGERMRRKIFAHYDTQSLLAKLHPGRESRSSSSRRNTTTGASAANYTTRCVMPISGEANDGEEVDAGDGKGNQLIQSCPYFRNEISSKDCSPSSSPASDYSGGPIHLRRPQGRPVVSSNSTHGLTTAHFRPHHGTVVLEQDKASQIGKCAHNVQPKFEHTDYGAYYYRKYFHGVEHQNYFGIDEKLGPVAISVKKENVPDVFDKCLYRIIVRTSELSTLRGAFYVPQLSKDGVKARDIIECLVPEIQTSCLKLAAEGLKTEEQLLKLDEQAVTKHYKIGVMYCKAKQCTEEEMYNNEHSGPAFNEFLDLIGQRVLLKDFPKYRGGLDNKSDSTGPFSLYTEFHGMEIMFHVSTMLPFTPSNRQQLLRKRHIGNDIVTIVFQEPGALPFSPKTIRSHFQHVFIVVQVVNPNTERTQYTVSISRSRDVPPFGPPLPDTIVFDKSDEFVDFLLTKVINAENAAHKSDKFVTLATRTRLEYLKDLATNYVTHTSLDSGFGKMGVFSFAARKKDRTLVTFPADSKIRAALNWSVKAKDFDPFSVEAIDGKMLLGISAAFFVLVDLMSGAVVKIIPNTNIMAWKSQEESLTIYYHVGEAVQIICESAEDWREIIQRLKAVTTGVEVNDVALTRNSQGHLGFHTQFDGVVTDVDSRSNAWKAGLRRGCILLEICGRSVNLLDHETMADLLRNTNPVTVTVLNPTENGNPRRGCNRPVCIRAPEHELSSNYDNLSSSVTAMDHHVPLTGRSSSSLIDGHVAFYVKAQPSVPLSQLTPSFPVKPAAAPEYDVKMEPSLDDLEAESRWWVTQMAEESARLKRLNPNLSSTTSFGYSTNRVTNPTEMNADQRRKLSPNSSIPLFDSGTDTMSSTTSKSSSNSQKENRGRHLANRSSSGRHKTDPGLLSGSAVKNAPVRAAVPLRNSNNQNRGSPKKNPYRHSASLQEELMKLIDPKLIQADTMSPVDNAAFNDAYAAALDGVTQRKSQSVDTPTPPVSASKSMEAIPYVDQNPADWSSLLEAADRAVKASDAVFYEKISPDSWASSLSTGTSDNLSPSPLRARASSQKYTTRPISGGEFQPDRFVPAARIEELESQISKLIQDLHKEREGRLALQTEVRQLRSEQQRIRNPNPLWDSAKL